MTIQNIQPAKRKILDRFSTEEKISPLRRFTRWLYLEVTSAAEKNLYTRQPGPVFLPVSRGVEAELRSYYDIGPSSVRIVPNAADPVVFHPVSSGEREAWRAAQGYKERDVVAIFSGGEWARKGLDFALRALGQTSRSEIKLFVAGDDPDRQRFKNLANECGITPRVIFGGFRKDMALAMASSDLFLFPSHYEAFSLATIEAAACGLPVLATSINGTEDFIQPGVTGEFLEHDPKQIACVLDRLAGAPETRKSMGEAGHQLVTSNYTWDRVTDLTEAAYRECLALRAHASSEKGAYNSTRS